MQGRRRLLIRFLGYGYLTSQYCKTAVTSRYVCSDGLVGFLGVFMYYNQPTTPYIGVYVYRKRVLGELKSLRERRRDAGHGGGGWGTGAHSGGIKGGL